MKNAVPLIALVENDVPMNRALGRLLRAQGLIVESFPSAELYLARDATAVIDCLLLDINLDGMSGLELQRNIRNEGSTVPIIFMTGQDDPRVQACAIEAGCSAFLLKPFEAQLLTKVIRAALQLPFGVEAGND